MSWSSKKQASNHRIEKPKQIPFGEGVYPKDVCKSIILRCAFIINHLLKIIYSILFKGKSLRSV